MDMKEKGFFKKVDDWLWRGELINATPLRKRLWHFTRILVAVTRDILKGHITLHAMGLVYTTILSSVPFLALSFSVLKGFGVHNQLEPLLDNVLAAPLGERGPEVVANLLGFVDNIKVGVLGSVGLGLLIYTVISLIQKVERSFNEIWRVTTNRSLAQRFSNYLSVVMIGPLLIFSAIGATATLIDSAWIKELIAIDAVGWIFTVLSRLTPYVIIIGLFTFLYGFIPNTRVGLKHAFIGGIVAGCIWQTTIFGFTLFAASSTQYTAIYSGFAIGILLLIWVYLAWLILLIGASVSFYSQHAQQITKNRTNPPCAKVDEIAGLSIIYQVAERFDQTGGNTNIDDMSASLAIGPEVIQRLIKKMLTKNLLVLSGKNSDALMPAKSLDKLTLTEVLKTLREEETSLPYRLQRNKSVDDIIQKVAHATTQALGDLTLAQWVRNTAAEKEAANVEKEANSLAD